MKSSLRAGCCWSWQLGAATSEPFRLAEPGYRYAFPRDNFNHPEFQTEWWYYTGNLQSSTGRRFGFELTFFRQGVDRERDCTRQSGTYAMFGWRIWPSAIWMAGVFSTPNA